MNRFRGYTQQKKRGPLLASTSAKSHLYRFGSFEFDSETGVLRKEGMRIRLEGQPAVILAMLLERPSELVTREELQRKLWPSQTFVDFEQSLNAAIRRLRLALNDSAESPRYVETLARRGYRWVAPLRGIAPTVSVEDRSPGPQARVRPRLGSRAAWIGLAIATTVAAIFAAPRLLRPGSEAGKVMLVVLPFQNLSDDGEA